MAEKLLSMEFDEEKVTECSNISQLFYDNQYRIIKCPNISQFYNYFSVSYGDICAKYLIAQRLQLPMEVQCYQAYSYINGNSLCSDIMPAMLACHVRVLILLEILVISCSIHSSYWTIWLDITEATKKYA